MALAKKSLYAEPMIIGVLGARQPPRAWLTRLTRACKRCDRRAVCLTFEIESRYLKNTIACMQLMDIKAIVLHGQHRKAMAKLVPHLSPLAKTMEEVDLIVRHRRKFVGLAARGEALFELLKTAITQRDF